MNEVLYSLNKPEYSILAVVEFLGENDQWIHSIHRPFQRVPDFGVTRVNYNFSKILKRAEEPR